MARLESGRAEHERGERFFIPIGVPSPGEPLPDLPGVNQDLKVMQTIFVDALGYSPVPFLNNPTANQLRKTLSDWLGAVQLTSADSVAVYYSGHGHVDPSGHYLYTRGFRTEAPGDGLKSQALVELILGRKARPGKLWLILDCCHAGGVLTAELCRSVIVGQTGAFVLAASGSYGQAMDGAFSGAFYEAVRRLGRGTSLDRVTASINMELAKKRRGSPAVQLGFSSTEFDFLNSLRTGLLPEPADARRRRLTRVALAAGIVAAGAAVGAGLGLRHARQGSAGPAAIEVRDTDRTVPGGDANRVSPASGGARSVTGGIPAPFAAIAAKGSPRLSLDARAAGRPVRSRGGPEDPSMKRGPASDMASAACVRLLERQSLGESLSSEENASLARECRKR